jgi:hypothetical protein
MATLESVRTLLATPEAYHDRDFGEVVFDRILIVGDRVLLTGRRRSGTLRERLLSVRGGRKPRVRTMRPWTQPWMR